MIESIILICLTIFCFFRRAKRKTVLLRLENRKMIITVTDDDIKNGIPCDTKNCPVALAVKRLFNNKVNVEVGGWLRVGNMDYSISLAGIDFIGRFDKGEKDIWGVTFEAKLINHFE